MTAEGEEGEEGEEEESDDTISRGVWCVVVDVARMSAWQSRTRNWTTATTLLPSSVVVEVVEVVEVVDWTTEARWR